MREHVPGRRGRTADVEHRGAVRHAGRDRADAVLGESLGEGDPFLLEVVGADQVDAEAREVARSRGAIDVEIGDPYLEETAGQLLLDQAAGAHRRFVHDEVVRRDAEGEPVAMRQDAQCVVAGGDRLDADRARGRIGMKLSNRPRQQLQGAFDGSDVAGAWR